MAYTLEILILIIGIIYGYMKPGKEDRSALFEKRSGNWNNSGCL